MKPPYVVAAISVLCVITMVSNCLLSYLTGGTVPLQGECNIRRTQPTVSQ